MKRSASERSFERGLRSHARGNSLEALAYFEAALRLEEGSPRTGRRARIASYYGICLASALGRTREGLELCSRAANSDLFSPDIYLNLARVQIMTTDRRGAWNSLVRGLSLDPGHRAIRSEMRKMGLRRRPALAFLGRSHPVNRNVGILADKLSTKKPGHQKGRG